MSARGMTKREQQNLANWLRMVAVSLNCAADKAVETKDVEIAATRMREIAACLRGEAELVTQRTMGVRDGN